MRYGSVCSGIEAASMAWEPLGWEPAWFSEIEAFPSAVLAHHWPTVRNLGDMTQIHHGIEDGTIEAPDLLVGGTPCQAFSVAGLRSSLDDARGQLTLHFVGLANAIDNARTKLGLPPAIVVWENVPGVLNTPDNAFGCFLGALAGEDVALLPPGGRWTNAGVVIGPSRAIAWRILDAQYFGVAQRRRRVFVAASAREGFCPDEVLFESDGVRRDSPPSRKKGEGFTHDVAPSLVSSGRGSERVGETRGQGPVIAVAHVEILPTMTSGGPKGTSHGQVSGQMRDAYMVPCLGFNARQDPDVWENRVSPLDTDGGTQAVAVTVDVFHTLRAEGFDASEDGTGRGAGAGAVAFSSKDYGADASEDLAPTMRSMGHNESHANGGGQLAVAFDILGVPATRGAVETGVHTPLRARVPGQSEASTTTVVVGPVAFDSRQDPVHSTEIFGSLGSRTGAVAALAPHENQRHELTLNETAGTVKCAGGKPGQGYPAALVGMQVRRLTPTECERLQGFPDGHTLIPWRGRTAQDCPDGPRYKALGNSMCVAVMHWIGKRIHRQVEATP